jgi:hypothetical protein
MPLIPALVYAGAVPHCFLSTSICVRLLSSVFYVLIMYVPLLCWRELIGLSELSRFCFYRHGGLMSYRICQPPLLLMLIYFCLAAHLAESVSRTRLRCLTEWKLQCSLYPVGSLFDRKSCEYLSDRLSSISVVFKSARGVSMTSYMTKVTI